MTPHPYAIASGELEKTSLSFSVISSFTSSLPPNTPFILIGQQSTRSTSPTLPKLVDARLIDEIRRAKSTRTFMVPEATQMTKISVIPVPPEASRHNSRCRPDVVAKALGGVVCDMVGSGSILAALGIFCFIESLEDVTPLTRAIARCFPRYTAKTGDESKKTIHIFFVLHGTEPNPDDLQTSASRATAYAHYVRFAQALIDMPPCLLNTDDFTRCAIKGAEKFPGVKVKVIKGEELAERGFGGIYGVGKAGTQPPALVHLSLDFGHASSIAFVGKGVVYDSGGLALKPREGMCGMKTDMGGAAGVLCGFLYACEMIMASEPLSLDSSSSIHCILCLVENCIGPSAFRNDDVLKMYSGLSVEVNNTDAEGRLILSDGVAYARKEIPGISRVLDMATLTGAQGVATGKQHAGLFVGIAKGKDDLLAQRNFHDREHNLESLMIKLGKRTGDLCHPLLFAPELHRQLFKSEVADMKNSVSDRSDAQSSCAGWFIFENLEKAGGDKEVEYVHVDMTYPAVSSERGTGFGVALVGEMAQEWVKAAV